MIQSIISVVAGFVVMAGVVIAGTAAATELIVPGGLFDAATGSPSDLPPTYFAANLMVSAVAALLGGWITARMAPSREMVHVFALAILVILMSLPGLIGYDEVQASQPGWYRIFLPLLGVSGAILGGWLRSRVVVQDD